MSNARPLLRRCFAISLGLLVVPIPVITHAQTNVQIQTPVQRLSDHYYEYTGSSWFMGGFNNGGFGPPPPFGDYAGGGSTFGFGGGGWGFNFLAAQGSSRSYVAQAPSVTLIPGTFGSFQDLTMRPFVTGIVPFVGSPLPNYGISPASPPWNAVEVRDYVQKRRVQRATQLQQEETNVIVGPPPTRQDDDPPLRLK
ncbi:MAG: hypothetical protein ABGX22_15065 [Pirellulaceae bacterium]